MLPLLSIVLRYKWVVIAVTAAGFALSAVVSLILPPRYVSSAAFMTIGVAQDVTALRDYFAAFGEFGDSYAMLIRGQKNLIIDSFLRSDRVTDAIVRRFDLVRVYRANDREDARRKLRRNTRVTIGDEGVIYLGVEDRSAERAHGLASAYLSILDSLILDLMMQNSRESMRFYGEEIERIERDIAVSDSLLGDYLREHHMYDMEEQMHAMLDVITSLSARLSIVDLEKRILETTMKPGTPSYERTKLEWEKLREQLLLLRDTGVEPALFPSFKNLPGITAGYVRLLSTRRVKEFVLAFLRVRRAEARIASESGTGTLRIIDPPAIPEKRSWPKRKQIVLFSTVASFFWAVLGLLVRERIRDGTLTLLTYNPPNADAVRGTAGPRDGDR
jgi:tyrosine-protein kinase Etk/Wzc